MKIKTGEKAPDFELYDECGATVALSDYHGMWVLLYFYPKDDTPGCTKEAEAFRDAYAELEKHNLIVLGVSMDNAESHQKFKEKHNLPFILLSDEDGEVAELYSIFNEDRKVAKRASFLIDSNGTLIKIYDYVEPEVHAQEVLQDLKECQEF